MTYRILAILLLLVNTLTLHSQSLKSMYSHSETQLNFRKSVSTVEGVFYNIQNKFGDEAVKDVFNHVVNEQIEDIFDKYVLERTQFFMGKDTIIIDDYAKIIKRKLDEYAMSFVMNGNIYVLTYNPVESPTLSNIERHLFLYGLDSTGEWFEATDVIKTDIKRDGCIMSVFFPFHPQSYVKKLEDNNIVIMYVLYHEHEYRSRWGDYLSTSKPYYKIITFVPKNNREFDFVVRTDDNVKKYINKE